MEVIEIKTLIDITNTNVRRNTQGSSEQFDQFRNWTTLLQSIGLRSIIEYDKNPVSEMVDVKHMGFGSKYKGTHRVWTFYFRPDREDAYANNGDHIAFLKEDLNKIPIIVNLKETINIDNAVFELTDIEFTNTVVKAF